MHFAALVLAAIAIAGLGSPLQAAPAETVEFKSGDLNIKAWLFKPDGVGPFPAVVGMHGCEGLLAPSGALAGRYRDWAERLGRAGFAVLYPDSLGARGIENQCRNRASNLRTSPDRISEANAARDWLQEQSFIKPDRVSLIGWSNGGTSVLWTVRRHASVVAKDGKPDFRSAIAFYPGCTRLESIAWSARVPTLILAGGNDDWSAARQCEKMAANARGRSARVSVIVYPGAYHDFDHPNRPLQIRSGYAFSVDGSGRIHTGSNPAARNDAHRRVLHWLAR
jgi:dienelactone hydrolase